METLDCMDGIPLLAGGLALINTMLVALCAWLWLTRRRLQQHLREKPTDPFEAWTQRDGKTDDGTIIDAEFRLVRETTGATGHIRRVP